MKLKLASNLFRDGNNIISYETVVAQIKGSQLIELGKYSRTTSKHIHKVAALYGLEIVQAKKKQPFYQFEMGFGGCHLPGTLSQTTSLEFTKNIASGMEPLDALASIPKIPASDLPKVLKEVNRLGVDEVTFGKLRKWHTKLKQLA
jgi:hypothetical protein